MKTTLDITPSPRVLRMLGQIDFAPWQCLAELVDNSIDAFLDQHGTAHAISNPKVTIELPSEPELRDGSGRLTVKDNGPGMTLAQLGSAVKAGYSGNDPVEKMGLFGMGFNISTARLGRRTEVWTTKSDSPDWVGVIIDFEDLEKSQTFKAPVLKRPKTEIELQTNARGTEIRITKLEQTRTRALTWGAGKATTKQRLGKVYGRVMASLGLSIVYDGSSIKPWRHCTWDAHRSVPNAEFGNIPARIDIDEELPSRKFCCTCWVWLNPKDVVCPACGEKQNLIDRKRKLRGWIGVQRYFDKEHYGIDLIRNGRVVEQLDKSLFYYNNANGDSDLEYPLDAIHWGGRIVGELEINFVRVSHQKDAFDKLDPEWQQVVAIVRGGSPLRPKIAERLNLSRNTSPLARLYAGYKAGHAGLRELVPGDSNGRGLNTGDVREWVKRFEAGESEFQSDQKWYELVLQVEKAQRGESSGGTEAAGDLPIAGTSDNEVEDKNADAGNGEQKRQLLGDPPPPPEQFVTDSELSRVYELQFQSGIAAITVIARKAEHQAFDKPFHVEATAAMFRFDYNPRHNFFEASLDTPLDCMVTDLAQHFLAISAETPRDMPVSMIERRLREKYFPETLSNVTEAAETAESILVELREHFDISLPQVAPIDQSVIDQNTLAAIKLRALQADLGDDAFVREVIQTGRFAKYVDHHFIVKLIRRFPSLVMDGAFFSTPLNTLSDELKDEAVAMVANGMEDIRWLAEEGSDALAKDLAWRLRFARALASMRLVESWRS